MNYKIYFTMLISIIMVGCGGGGANNTGGSSTGVISPSEINLSKLIQSSSISNYDTTDPIEDQYLAVINYFRSQKIKCNDTTAITGPSNKDMEWDQSLADSAEEHSEDMKLSVHYDHAGSGTTNDITGQTFSPPRASRFEERIIQNGYASNMSAENIAMSASTPNPPVADYWLKVMEGWLTSTHGHCSNIMNPLLFKFGMHESRADVNASGWYNVYWTQDFGGN